MDKILRDASKAKELWDAHLKFHDGDFVLALITFNAVKKEMDKRRQKTGKIFSTTAIKELKKQIRSVKHHSVSSYIEKCLIMGEKIISREVMTCFLKREGFTVNTAAIEKIIKSNVFSDFVKQMMEHSLKYLEWLACSKDEEKKALIQELDELDRRRMIKWNELARFTCSLT